MDTELFKNLPDTRYATLVLDPPWSYDDKLGNSGHSAKMPPGIRSADAHYDTLSLAQIATLPVPDLAEKNAHLYVWVTAAFVPAAYDLIEGWGFRPILPIPWIKTKQGVTVPASPDDCAFGMGYYYRNMAEFALFAVRGSAPPASHSERPVVFAEEAAVDGVVYAPLGRHSEKPQAAYDLFARVSPGPRLDVFSRQVRPGYETWGDQAPENVV